LIREVAYMPRAYKGKDDLQRVSIYGIFPYTPIWAVAPIWHGEDAPIIFYGPPDHLKALHPHLLEVVKKSEIDPRGQIGTWVGLRRLDDRLEIYYQFGESIAERIVLLEHRLRTDIAFIEDICLNEVAVLEVVCENIEIIRVYVPLPEELDKNGSTLLVHPPILV